MGASTRQITFLQARGVSSQHVQVVWDAIALHVTHGTIALYKEPEDSVIFEAVAVDAVGYALTGFHQTR